MELIGGLFWLWWGLFVAAMVVGIGITIQLLTR